MLVLDAVAPDGSLVNCWVTYLGDWAEVVLVDAGRVYTFLIGSDEVRALLVSGRKFPL